MLRFKFCSDQQTTRDLTGSATFFIDIKTNFDAYVMNEKGWRLEWKKVFCHWTEIVLMCLCTKAENALVCFVKMGS